MFDWENAIALDTMQGNRASSRREGNVSWVLSSCGRNLGYILELQRGCPFETLVCSLKSGTCLGMSGNRSHPEMIWGERNIPQAALLKLMFLST